MSDLVKQAVQIWCDHFVEAIKLKTGATIAIGSFKEIAFNESANAGKWIQQKFSPASGKAWIYIPESTSDILCRSMAESTAVQDAPDQFQHSSLFDAIGQSFSAFALGLRTHTGGAIEALPPKTRLSPPPELEGISAQLETAEGTYEIGFVLDSELKAVICRPSSKEMTTPQKNVSAMPGLDLLMDVELPITVLIGSTQMALRDVLNLTTGSIVELDRLITDPVGIFVNKRLIARGEVVVIEGNYGVRILEVVSRSERMALRDGAESKGNPQNLRMEAGVGQ